MPPEAPGVVVGVVWVCVVVVGWVSVRVVVVLGRVRVVVVVVVASVVDGVLVVVSVVVVALPWHLSGFVSRSF
jgi:hypothetical protein